jgi:hypothetical protein
MGVFVQVIPDRWGSASQVAKKDTAGRGQASEPFIRRPTNGIQLKEETFATLRLVTAVNGQNQLLVDAGSRRKGIINSEDGEQFLTIGEKRATDIYSNFLLQSVQEERTEKQQILETFGEAYIFLFGQRARVITFSGILANTFDFNWEAEWWENYDTYLRGTRCVESQAQVFISYDNTLVGGYIIATSSSKDSTTQNYVQFTFQLFVTYYSNFSNVGNPSAFPPGVSSPVQYSTEDLKKMRPHLVDDIPIQNWPLLGNGSEPGLFDAISNGISLVSNAWNSAGAIVNSGVNKLSASLNLDGVRIPIGFAGSLVYDGAQQTADSELVELKQRAWINGRVYYTTFDKNAEEYVGKGSHYGSSAVSNFGKDSGLYFFGEDPYYLDNAYTKIQTATEIWAKNGYTMPPEGLGTISGVLANNVVGLVGVGATEVWRSATSSGEQGTATSPTFAVGSTSSGPPSTGVVTKDLSNINVPNASS